MNGTRAEPKAGKWTAPPEVALGLVGRRGLAYRSRRFFKAEDPNKIRIADNFGEEEFASISMNPVEPHIKRRISF